jgi:PAB-dependent poly(A)-specific ribonuclease subunit 3
MSCQSFIAKSNNPSYTDIFGSNPTQQKPLDDPGMQRILSETSTVPSGPTPPPFRSLHSLGLSDDNWRYYRDLKIEESRQMDPSDPRHKAIPLPYCNAFCLDPPNLQNSRSSFGYPAATFQVVNRDDGHLYCLRRFDNVKSVNPKIASTVLEQWASIEHPGIATLHQCFVSQRAVFFVHQYIPGTRSFLQVANPPTLSEPVIWSAICQMVTVIRRVHGARLAMRTLDLRHTLIQMDALRLRIFINCLGIVDALEYESRKSLQELQAEDMRNFGRWILSIVTGTNITISTDPQTLQNCERYCMQNYSRELRHFILTLIRSQNPPSILDVSRALSGRLMDELDSTQLSLMRTEKALSGEYESGRALRLLLKLGFVNERPENGANRRWSQSGDCYVLTLFRDYGKEFFMFDVCTDYSSSGG